MDIADIAKAAKDRLDALTAEAKPHEDALVAINAERAKLRAVVSAAGGGSPGGYAGGEPVGRAEAIGWSLAGGREV